MVLVCAALLCGALGPASASASHTQATFFEAPRDLLNVTPAARAKALAQLQSLGVKALRVELDWHGVAPAADSTKRPNFEATNPASYNWSNYDPLLAEAQRLHWQVLLTVTSPVPEWATAGHNDRKLVTRPNERQFEEFMTAVGRHYAGEVSLYAIWNEPDHPAFLQPQFNRNGTPASPRIYRGLFQAGYE
jgi:beta-glucosidase/6-phospho-beta-glucosidase/beta-galactosidase